MQNIVLINSQGQSFVMSLKTNILPVKTKYSNQLIKPLHIALTAHHLRDTQHWVRALNVFILNHLLPRREFSWICCQALRCLHPPITKESYGLLKFLCRFLVSQIICFMTLILFFPKTVDYFEIVHKSRSILFWGAVPLKDKGSKTLVTFKNKTPYVPYTWIFDISILCFG